MQVVPSANLVPNLGESMYCYLRYRHPKNGNQYYFVKFRDGRPIGCFPYRVRFGKATRFSTKAEARTVAAQLTTLGYTVYFESY